jgi:hypothetical protein
MEFLPSGYVSLLDAVRRLALLRNPDLTLISNYYISVNQTKATTMPSSRLASRVPPQDGQSMPASESRADELWRTFAARDEANKLLAAKQDATADLRQALGDGLMEAEAIIFTGGTLKIPIQAWRTADGQRSLQTGTLRWLDPLSGGIWEGSAMIAEHVFAQWLAKISSPLTFPAAGTVAQERRLKHWLIEKMKASLTSPTAKATVIAEAKAAGLESSRRGFDRAWAKPSLKPMRRSGKDRGLDHSANHRANHRTNRRSYRRTCMFLDG